MTGVGKLEDGNRTVGLLLRGGAASIAEGGPPPKNIIVVEFPSMEKLREWYASPEYAEALKVRRTALDRRLIFVEGVPPA